MRKKIERVAAQLGGNPERPIDEHPLVREKQAERERAELDLARTMIRAPLDGTAVNVRLQKGEQIKAATVLFALVAHTRPWVEANFKETELTHVRKGLTATVELDIYPGVVWQAEVDSISPATGAEFALLPPQNASGNWVKVVQRLPVRLRLMPQAGRAAAAGRHDGKRQGRYRARAQPEPACSAAGRRSPPRRNRQRDAARPWPGSVVGCWRSSRDGPRAAGRVAARAVDDRVDLAARHADVGQHAIVHALQNAHRRAKRPVLEVGAAKPIRALAAGAAVRASARPEAGCRTGR